MAAPAAGVAYNNREIGTANTANPQQAGIVITLAIRITVCTRCIITACFPLENAADTAGTKLVAKAIVKIAGN